MKTNGTMISIGTGKVLGLALLVSIVLCLPLCAQISNVSSSGSCQSGNGVETCTATTPDGPYPPEHPTVYYHDRDWRIDMLPQRTANDECVMQIRSKDGDSKTVTFPSWFAQVDSIYRVAMNRAATIVEMARSTVALAIVDLKQGKLIDQFGLDAPSFSPDHRFLIYINGYPPYEEEPPIWYHLYDLSKPPRENVCGYRNNDSWHRDLDESYRGILVYPRNPDTGSCSDDALKPLLGETHDLASNFVWSADSSKVVFADVKDDKMITMVLVTMPDDRENREDEDQDVKDRGSLGEHGMDRGRRDLPQTSIYTFTGADDVCAGATSCDYNNVKSVAWNGDAVNVALIQANPGGKAIEKDLTIPLTKFVPISNHRDHETGPGRHDGDHSDQGP